MGNGNGQQLVPTSEINPQVRGGGGAIRQDFGGTAIANGAQTMSDALAAQAKAAVEARYILAMRRPRDIDTVRAVLIRECKRPSFAEDARYSVPRGGKAIEGPSIRFAEAAKRAMGNMLAETYVVYDDADLRQLRVCVTDLEANDTYNQDVVVSKTVERRQLREGQSAKGTRRNSYGDVVYLVEASDDDLLNKQNALISKAMRTLILRLVPGDIIEEAMQRCVQTLNDRSAQDPDAARKQLGDAYMVLGIAPDQIAKYLGHPLQQTTQAEYAQLRALYTALRDGNVQWVDALEQRMEQRAADAAEPAIAPPPTSSTTTDAVKEAAGAAVARIAQQLGKDAAADAAPAPSSKPAPAAKPPRGTAGAKAHLQGRQQPAAAPPAPHTAGDEPGWFNAPLPESEAPDDDGDDTPQ